MPLPAMRDRIELEMVSEGFINALEWYAAFMSDPDNASEELRNGAGWAQHLFRRLGLNPSPSELVTRDQVTGLRTILSLRDGISRAVAKFGGFPMSNSDIAAKIANDPSMTEGYHFLARAFGSRDPVSNQPRPIPVFPLEVGRIARGLGPMETATSLRNLVDLLQDMIRADAAEYAREHGTAEPVYDRVVIEPIPDADEAIYDQAWERLESGRDSGVFTIRDAGASPAMDIYGPAPPFLDHAMSPDAAGRFEGF